METFAFIASPPAFVAATFTLTVPLDSRLSLVESRICEIVVL